MKVPYKEIALYALVKWNGKPIEEAMEMINTLSVDEIEKSVYAKSSVNHAIFSIASRLNLGKEETEELYNATYYGPEDAEIFNKVSKLIKTIPCKESFVLEILSDIHNGWVVDNSSEKTFNKKKDRKQLRQYLPLPLIGYNEVKSDLIFLKPILASCGLDTDSLRLEEKYHETFNEYIRNNDLTTFQKLIDAIRTGRDFYPYLNEEMSERLVPLAQEIVDQVYTNWTENDKESAIIFLNAMQDDYDIKNKQYIK